jgi:DNA-binding response OmpR family regulator
VTGSRALRIVVSDDDPMLLARLVRMLRDAGHGVFAAYDGLSALELAEYIPDLDLLITNTRIGDVPATELIRRVRAAKPWLAIIHVGDPLPDAEGPLANVPTLREPFTSDELLAAVDGALARGAR